MAEFSEADVERCLQDSGIVRHRRKIESTHQQRPAGTGAEAGVRHARRILLVNLNRNRKNRPEKLDFATAKTLGKTVESTELSKDLKKRGWSFVGPTTVYAFMQSMGMVNDHLEGCCCRESVEAARTAFKRPVKR